MNPGKWRRRVRAIRLVRLVALGAVVLEVAGCVGVSYRGTATFDSANPAVSAAEWPPRPPRARGQQSALDLVRGVGEPDERRRISESREEWVYLHGWRWNGPVLFVVVPIPLVIPVGHESSTYHLRDGVVERVVRVEQTWEGYTCAPFGHNPGCHWFGVSD